MTDLSYASGWNGVGGFPAKNGGARNLELAHQLRDAAGPVNDGLNVHDRDSRIFRRSLSSQFVGSSDPYFSTICHIVGMTNLKAIGRRVKWLRTTHMPKESQDTLAAAIGVTRSAIAGIETGGDRGGLETMIAIADYYKVPLDWLLCRKTPPGGPLVGEFIDDPDELAFALFWRGLNDSERATALRLLRIGRRDIAVP